MLRGNEKIITTIKRHIEEERVSYGEIAWLQSHRAEVLESNDIELAEWSGIDEDEWTAAQQTYAKERLRTIASDLTNGDEDYDTDNLAAELRDIADRI